jgi:glycosyltransferase involved in cell wall biosynthesis
MGGALSKAKVLIFIVSYNAEAFIESVLKRIPEAVWSNPHYSIEVLIIDDQSSDKTFQRALEYSQLNPNRIIQVLYNPVNQGYGGNQKLGYHYAIQNGFDAVVLLHGDGQYAPEYLDKMIMPIISESADVVLGSRMLDRKNALRGKMPLYKWFGNIALTYSQNKMLGSNLAEFHTGYRAYSTKALRSVPFEHNSNYFDFDTDILIQMMDTGQRFNEISIPTYYGEEISHVNAWRYGILILLTTLHSRLIKLNLFYDRRFDYQIEENNEYYSLKLGYPSSHQFALDHIEAKTTILDIGSGPGLMARELAKHDVEVISVDRHITPLVEQFSVQTIKTEVEDLDLSCIQHDIDTILLLDIIEHVREPEELLLKLRRELHGDKAPIVLITTGNVAFFSIRFGLLIGLFNYGKKGILDRDHRRLFTFGSMRHMLNMTGYEILEIKGIPAPYPLAIGDNLVSRFLLRLNQALNWVFPNLFAYQMAFIAKPRPTIEQLLEDARFASLKRVDGI